MKISVIMPVLNGAAYLAEAIESILAQTEPSFEFIILDDGSTDETPTILDRYAAQDDRIRVIRGKRPKGVAARLNQGVAEARAPLIARMDADDIALPDRFERQLGFLDANPDVVMAGSRVLLIDPEGAPLREMGDAFSHEEIDNGLLTRAGQLVFHSSIICRKNAVLAAGGYDESYPAAQDLDFFLRMAETGRIANLPETLLKYRHHFSSAGYARVLEQEAAIDRAIAAALKRRGLSGSGGQAANGGGRRRQPATKSTSYRIWGWWALQGGHPDTARKHAFRALVASPYKTESWRLMACALRGH